MRVAALHRYPVKGLSPERLNRAVLETGHHFPGDRLFAVENGPSGFDPAAPAHRSKRHFLMLMLNESLARLKTRYEDATGTLVIAHEGGEVRGNLGTDEGRAAIERFLEAYVPEAERRGPARLVTAPDGFRFTDTLAGHVSIINLASVAALEERLGAPVDPLRFRANVHVEDLPPFAEFDLIGRSFAAPSGLVLTITGRIDRCAATAVDPATGIRDLPIVKTLMGAYGHIDCGVFAEVTERGALAEGHRLIETTKAEPAGLGLR